MTLPQVEGSGVRDIVFERARRAATLRVLRAAGLDAQGPARLLSGMPRHEHQVGEGREPPKTTVKKIAQNPFRVSSAFASETQQYV